MQKVTDNEGFSRERFAHFFVTLTERDPNQGTTSLLLVVRERTGFLKKPSVQFRAALSRTLTLMCQIFEDIPRFAGLAKYVTFELDVREFAQGFCEEPFAGS
jgi:hypothetical protein